MPGFRILSKFGFTEVLAPPSATVNKRFNRGGAWLDFSEECKKEALGGPDLDLKKTETSLLKVFGDSKDTCMAATKTLDQSDSAYLVD